MVYEATQAKNERTSSTSSHLRLEHCVVFQTSCLTQETLFLETDCILLYVTPHSIADLREAGIPSHSSPLHFYLKEVTELQGSAIPVEPISTFFPDF